MVKHKPLVAIAMSGGVDSSVAALLLQQQGYQVVGLTMQLVPCGGEKVGGCCGIEAVRSAQRVCQKLHVPHYVVNFREPFQQTVIKNFIQEYGRGHTPNPCVICNEKIKFDLLLRRAKEIGADYLATGHYATIKKSGHKFCLLAGRDKNKDQSYFLYRLTQSQLKYLLFPLGNLTKPQVRQIASKAGLPTATKPESQ
ncbi:MAG: tRNA 2-thiouridine(34) synthase MnmA, partial [Candidatus Parcubacteria bacterium]|nr:tRNA 2-thiouridine(34) synthase MnmA [Candidatus Parcubacteria bacterium]